MKKTTSVSRVTCENIRSASRNPLLDPVKESSYEMIIVCLAICLSVRQFTIFLCDSLLVIICFLNDGTYL